MAIIRKDRLQSHLAELDAFHQRLRRAIEGVAPNPNNCLDYNCETDQFQREYTEVDLTELNYAILHYKAAVDGLKEIKKLQAQRNKHR